MDLPKKGVTLTLCGTAANFDFFFNYILFTTPLPISQVVGVTAGTCPTTPVSGHKPNVCSYFHNRLLGTSIPSLAGSLTKSQSHEKKGAQKPTGRDATLTANTTAERLGRVKALDTLATY